MEINNGRIQSDLIIHPGEELADVLAALEMSQKTLAFKSGISRKHINRIIKGKERISPKVAMRLESVLGTPASFWVNLMRNYELDIAKKESSIAMEKSVHELEHFPIKEMVEHGLLKKALSPVEQVKQLLSYLGVANFSIFRKEMEFRFAASYRKAVGKNVSKEALAVWIRAGQIQAQAMKLPKYQEAALKAVLPELRKKTQDINEFAKVMRPMLGECGVPVVLVPHLKGTYVNGATYWIEDGSRPVIQLSLRQKWCDIIFFSLFHEIAHVLKHPRTSMFIEGNVSRKLEQEADTFASESLIPKKVYREFLVSHPAPTPSDVKAFAKAQEIHPCVVVGRLQKDEVLHYSDYYKFKDCKPQYEWAASNG